MKIIFIKYSLYSRRLQHFHSYVTCVFYKELSNLQTRQKVRLPPLGSDPGGGVGLGMEGVGSLWWRRGGGGSKLSRRAVSSMQKVFKSDALGDDWPRRSADLPLIGAASEE
ncbi:hypothetical protein ILYODFUR_027628 [Ilyodon furcidens]|uniref:Uncharacterized protein n=1 Tax=Ilyodon furcidens TaxID=33524 RepID=A0ABV0UKM0_9TELE